MNNVLDAAGIGTVLLLKGGWFVLVILDSDRNLQLRSRCSSYESGLAYGKERWPGMQWLPERGYCDTVERYARQT